MFATPINSRFNMEGYSFGGSAGGGVGLEVTPRIGLQGILTYRVHGDVDNWTRVTVENWS